MNKSKIILPLLLFLFFSSGNAGEKIVRLSFSGLEKTSADYLHNFIKTTEGADFDSSQVAGDLQRLRNLRLFLHIDYSLNDTPHGKHLDFHCEELITLLPIVNFGGVTDNFWFQLGLVDYNWLGRGNTLGAYYRYYDRHSFEVFLHSPYLFSKAWGITANIARFSTIEPAYFDDTVADYNVDHWAFISTVRYSLSRNTAFELGGGYLREKYEKNKARSGAGAPGPDLVNFDKYLLKFIIRQEHINYFYHYLYGFSNEVNFENVTTAGEDKFFWKFLNISKFFLRSGQRGNWAFRLRLGISTNENSPFVPFVLDNYVTVRGSGNRVSRGTAEITINSEYRHSFMEKEWGAVQGVVFIDMSAWRPAAGKFSEMFKSQNNVTFNGIGIRLHLRRFNNFVFRLDYGISVTGDRGKGIVFGAGQYF